MIYNLRMADSLSERFDNEMHELYLRIVRECGGKYRPTKFHEMLVRDGGLATAHQLLRPGADFFSYGFQRLCELKKSSVTMEAMILDLDYADQLFTAAELQTARERLEAAEAWPST